MTTPTNEDIQAERARLEEQLSRAVTDSRARSIKWMIDELDHPCTSVEMAEMSEEHADLVVLAADWRDGWTETRPSEVFDVEEEER